MRLFTLVLALLFSVSLYAQDSTAMDDEVIVSLLTCGPGTELYSIFGHSAVRVQDKIVGRDIVYNYGTFSGFDPDFEIKFMRGKLLYYLSIENFSGFAPSYAADGRSVREQVLKLSPAQEEIVVQLLEDNLKEENKYYKYDFLFDNCSTRIRDLLPKIYGSSYQWGKHPDAGKITFRDAINKYLAPVHWERLGINILLGRRMDVPASNEALMFLPDYLEYGLQYATAAGSKITNTEVLNEGNETGKLPMNLPLVVLWLLFCITFLIMTLSKSLALKNILSFFWLFLSGLLGCLMLFMWLGTDHQACAQNFNFLWALPTNLVLAFLPKRSRKTYAIFAIAMLMVVLLMHLFSFQKFPLLELAPFLLSLLMVYAHIAKPKAHRSIPGND